jgi:hypothetical protein
MLEATKPSEKFGENAPPDSLPANASLFSMIQRGIPASDEVVYLVSREGKKLAIQEQVLKNGSNFFRATLETSMRESGKHFSFAKCP